MHRTLLWILFLLGTSTSFMARQSAAPFPTPVEKDFVVRNFRFQNGQTLPEVRIHYRTIGMPVRNAAGQIQNGILLLHGSSSDGTQLLAPSFSNVLFSAGQPLDATKYFLIIPDLLGNGKSTKPSDGLRAKFPKYGYTDMVELEHRLIVEELGIRRLRAVMGISMGGMHTWMWGEKYADMMDALIPIAAQPVAVDGRNLLWRRILSRAIRTDPEWQNGDYKEQPRGFISIMPMFDMLVQSPIRLGETLNMYDKADAYLQQLAEKTRTSDDANNILYRFEASFDYNPAPSLERIKAPVLAILFADDELNPPETGVMEQMMLRVKSGKLIMMAASAKTQGHRTQVQAELWRDQVAEFMKSLQ